MVIIKIYWKQLIKRSDIFNLIFNILPSKVTYIVNIQRKCTVCSYHVTYLFQIESTMYSCLNVKKLLVRNRSDIWNLSDCNGTWTHNHLVCKQTLNQLAKLASLAKWLSVHLWTELLRVWVLLQSLTENTVCTFLPWILKGHYINNSLKDQP